MIENLLVPHDLTDLADAGFDVLRLLGGPVGRVHVLHVLPRIDLETPTLVWSRDDDDARMTHGRQALAARLAGTPYENAVLHVRIGDPASRIVELAREIGANLVSMGSHGRTGMMRFVLGSVSNYVARFAPCPVLIVPAHATLPPQVSLPDEEDLPIVTRDEQVEAVAVEIARRIDEHPGQYLTAVRIAVPSGETADAWEAALIARLGARGIQFMDLVFTPAGAAQAKVLTVTFEERFA